VSAGLYDVHRHAASASVFSEFRGFWSFASSVAPNATARHGVAVVRSDVPGRAALGFGLKAGAIGPGRGPKVVGEWLAAGQERGRWAMGDLSTPVAAGRAGALVGRR